MLNFFFIKMYFYLIKLTSQKRHRHNIDSMKWHLWFGGRQVVAHRESTQMLLSLASSSGGGQGLEHEPGQSTGGWCHMGFGQCDSDLTAFLLLPPSPLPVSLESWGGGTSEGYGHRPGFECGEWEQPWQMGHPCPAGVDKIHHL